jgi:hypothetical protein
MYEEDYLVKVEKSFGEVFVSYDHASDDSSSGTDEPPAGDFEPSRISEEDLAALAYELIRLGSSSTSGNDDPADDEDDDRQAWEFETLWQEA